MTKLKSNFYIAINKSFFVLSYFYYLLQSTKRIVGLLHSAIAQEPSSVIFWRRRVIVRWSNDRQPIKNAHITEVLHIFLHFSLQRRQISNHVICQTSSNPANKQNRWYMLNFFL